ncbi:methyltransferase [Ramlibacter sp. MMS24-I3-19]|uniref:methyltransferase n=1 Tax=Ramlibacter sp. MMS24-I3-19 TaxID=3416606 RepID=UPI003D092FE4
MSTPATERMRLLELIGSSWRTQAIHAMVELRIADRLAAGSMQPPALAAAVGADAGALERLLRGLRLLGLLEACPGGVRLTCMGRMLRTDSEQESLADWVRWWAGAQWGTWGHLPEAVREGEPMRARCSNAGGYGLHATDAAVAQLFHSAMGQLTSGIAPVLIERIGCLCSRHIVDVGGGRGELLVQVLRACPEARGILLEQEHAAAAARDHLEHWDLLRRCTVVTGDFFRDIPAGAQIYLLKSVLHNWDDVAAEHLLHACRSAMTEDAALAIIERVLDDQALDEAIVRSDLNMLVSLGGRERSVREMQQLLRRCGLSSEAPLVAGEHRLFVCRAV